MTDLVSGTYVPNNTKTVTVWPKPDANGDGDEVFVMSEGPNGEFLGQNLARDNAGNPIRHYLPPAGFESVRISNPGADGLTECYTRMDPRTHKPLRNHLGEAVTIMEGSALVEHGDGTFSLLRDDWSKIMFLRQHVRHGEPAAAAPAAPPAAPVPAGPESSAPDDGISNGDYSADLYRGGYR